MGAEDAARASAPPPGVTAVGEGATQAPANLDSDAGPDEPTYSPLPAAQDSAMSDVHGTMGSDNDSDDESPIYSDEVVEGNDEDGDLAEGDQGEQYWN